MDPWDAVEPDRQAFANYLASLDPSDWSAPSWCAGWDVKAVAAHLLVPPTKSKGQVFGSFVKAGFNLDKLNARYVAALTESMTPEQIVSTTRSSAGVRSAPPGLPPIGVLNEVVVHTMDISHALGKPFVLPMEHYVMALEHSKNVQAVLGCKERIAGLTLRGTDSDWSTGSGPVVEGPTDLLLAAMTGRKAALASLDGAGLDTLARR